MRSIFFDTGPLISFSMNNLLGLFNMLKEKFGGSFMITESVKKEAVTNPLTTKKFKFEAIQNLKLIEEGVFEIYQHEDLDNTTHSLLNLANHIFSAHDNFIKIIHYAETEVIAGAMISRSNVVVIDEFTTRALIEDPNKVKDRLKNKLHTEINIDEEKLSEFMEKVRDIRVIRSTELMTIAYELGFLDSYMPKTGIKEGTLLDAVLWGLRLNGCSISTNEIQKIEKIEKQKILVS